MRQFAEWKRRAMQDKLFLALMNTQGAHAEWARKEFEALGLTEGQPKILYILRVIEGCVQKELAAACKIRESTLTVHLLKLEGLGYIEKRQVCVSGGKSAKAIYLKDSGRKMADRIFEIVEGLEEKSFRRFSEAEKKKLFELLCRIEENLLDDRK